jgi:hypothetical protein
MNARMFVPTVIPKSMNPNNITVINENIPISFA